MAAFFAKSVANSAEAVKLAKHFFEKQKTPGSIVMTSSTAGVAGDMYNPAYMASKHGVGVPSVLIVPFDADNYRYSA